MKRLLLLVLLTLPLIGCGAHNQFKAIMDPAYGPSIHIGKNWGTRPLQKYHHCDHHHYHRPTHKHKGCAVN